MLRALLFASLVCSGTHSAWWEKVGPWYTATKGELFPRARHRSVEKEFFVVKSSTFRFKVSGKTCDILEDALRRYRALIVKEEQCAVKAAVAVPDSYVHDDPNMKGDLIYLDIVLENPCERIPHLRMNENYTLEVSEKSSSGRLTATHVWGILRGLESFSQLLAQSPDGHLTMQVQSMTDSPRFPHRGLLMDTSRHFIPVSDILLTLDAMSYNKLNVFHWHIIDDNAFPYVSTAYPGLSAKGAYHPTMVYTPADVRRIIEYGRLRGIRVVSEFDTPAHTQSWGMSHPELLTECHESGKPNGKLGPLNPTRSEVWRFLETLFAEVLTVFPDKHVHLGGDEIDFACWSSNPEIRKYMKEHGYKEEDLKKLEADYFETMFRMMKNANASSIVWQEVFEDVADLPAETVVQIWNGDWRKLMGDVVSKKHPAILSECWYLSMLQSGADWIKFYNCDPTSFNGTPEMKSLVLGGEACMWAEYVDAMNVHQRIWPRASAVAERLWTHTKDFTINVQKRLEEHACRMNRRGVPAQPPNGSGFCVL